MPPPPQLTLYIVTALDLTLIIAESFNDYFVNICPKLASEVSGESACGSGIIKL